ncbi:predicted protein [Botrytis cinerea T4]|uniref:Uncharacterized protein n=1 Tax=Botryotinia fuckeliana (strain T4) TaxID=999810 RepID=G2Y899_BOTF4|nr:predicted protein [Botrytis cinerea T4]
MDRKFIYCDVLSSMTLVPDLRPDSRGLEHALPILEQKVPDTIDRHLQAYQQIKYKRYCVNGVNNFNSITIII